MDLRVFGALGEERTKISLKKHSPIARSDLSYLGDT